MVDDGSPPLYYVALHYWMRLFGQSEVATHTLSLVPSLLAIPAAWWSAGRLFGRWAARAAAGLVATCAYLAYYSTETRMYSWLVLVALLAITCFVLAYGGAGRRYWVATTLLMAAVLYLQYYGLYLLAATVIVGSAVAARRRAWSQLRATWLYGAACAALFSPWAAQFLYQLRNTGRPVGAAPGCPRLLRGLVQRPGLGRLGRGCRRPGRRRPQPPAPRPAGAPDVAPGVPILQPGASPLALFTAVPLVTLLLAWLVGQFVNSWDPRYLGIAVVPALVPLAGGLARARGRTWVTGLVVLALAGTSVPVLVDKTVTVDTSKSDVAYLVSELAPLLQPGALVISPEVTDTPVIAADLGGKYQYATPFGLMADPMVVNWSTWRPASAHQCRLEPGPFAQRPARGRPGARGEPDNLGRRGTRTYAGPVEEEAIAATNAVLDDPQLQSVETLGVPRYSNSLYPMNAGTLVL